MRLRPLTEAECYARCYGGRTDDRVSLVFAAPVLNRLPELNGERLRRLFDTRIDPIEPGHGREAA